VKEKPPAAKVLEKTLARFRGDLTVADAAAKAGLPLREAEEGLQYLAAEYSGHLAATSKGELIYSFPEGLVRPAETRLWRRAARGVVNAVLATGRFVLRAWVSVVLVGYALVFLVLLLAVALRSDDRDGPGEALGIVFRLVAEALFWTFHPFSPVYLRREPDWMHRTRRHRKIPFYERVNRYVFGPPKPVRDPREQERHIVAEIRRGKGRIAPADVMRVTGLEREAAERLLLRLVVDYDGEIEVSDTGAVVYRFSNLRTTVDARERLSAPPPAWAERLQHPPLTGNTASSNLLFTFINGFNLITSGYVLANGLTLERLAELFARTMTDMPGAAGPLAPADGTPLVLGAIPFAFSVAVFALPLMRAVRRPAEAKRIARENGWRGLLRLAVANRQGRIEYTRDELERAWTAAGGSQPTDTELRDAVRALGGDIDVRESDGAVVYRFDLLEREAQATEQGRRLASEEEARAGEVVFSSAAEGAGILAEAGAGERGGRGSGGGAGDREQRPVEGRSGEEPAIEGRSGPRGLIEEKEVLDFIERLGVDTRRRER
jgi:hypothetical protein